MGGREDEQEEDNNISIGANGAAIRKDPRHLSRSCIGPPSKELSVAENLLGAR